MKNWYIKIDVIEEILNDWAEDKESYSEIDFFGGTRQ